MSWPAWAKALGACLVCGAPTRGTTCPRHRPQSRRSRAQVLEAVSEKQWQEQVLEWAHRGGWLVHKVFDSRRSPSGWPDLFLVRGERIIAAELKSRTGQLSAAQRAWLEALGATGKVECHVWKPAQADEVRRLLTAGVDLHAQVMRARLSRSHRK